MSYPHWLSTDIFRLIEGGAAAVALMLMALLIRSIWKRHNSGLMTGIHGKYPARREAEQNKDIYNELVELRVLTEADRASVLRFHNGTEFLPSHPAWKLSCTNEVVRHGITYEAARLQGLLVSLIPNIVSPLLTGLSSNPGIKIPECPECPFKTKCLKENKRVVVIQVDEMENCFSQFHLEGQNIKTVVMCGIASGGNVYGAVILNFCDAKLKADRLTDVTQKICRATDKIQFYLQYKKIKADLIKM